jgi:hypothetical protein
MKKNQFFKKTLQMVAIVTLFCVTISANAQDKIQVVYDGNGATSNFFCTPGGSLYFVGDHVEIVKPPECFEKTGYKFMGWASSMYGGEPKYMWDEGLDLFVPEEFIMPDYPVVLYAIWELLDAGPTPITLNPICADETTYIITGKYHNASDITANVENGCGSVTALLIPGDGTLTPPTDSTYIVTYTLGALNCDAGATVQIHVVFEATDPFCGDEEALFEFTVYELPIAPTHEETCEGATGTITVTEVLIAADMAATHYAVVGTGYDSGFSYDKVYAGLQPGTYTLYKKNLTTGCVVAVENITVEDCCVAPASFTIEYSGKQ